jgi:hypothetical protein
MTLHNNITQVDKTHYHDRELTRQCSYLLIMCLLDQFNSLRFDQSPDQELYHWSLGQKLVLFQHFFNLSFFGGSSCCLMFYPACLIGVLIIRIVIVCNVLSDSI